MKNGCVKIKNGVSRFLFSHGSTRIEHIHTKTPMQSQLLSCVSLSNTDAKKQSDSS